MKLITPLLIPLYYNIFACGYPQKSDSSAKILKYTNDNDGLGSYKFEYETDNGINHSEQGTLKEIGEGNTGIAAKGSYLYEGENGEVISVSYTADENGYRPKVTISLSRLDGEQRAPPQLIASLVG